MCLGRWECVHIVSVSLVRGCVQVCKCFWVHVNMCGLVRVGVSTCSFNCKNMYECAPAAWQKKPVVEISEGHGRQKVGKTSMGNGRRSRSGGWGRQVELGGRWSKASALGEPWVLGARCQQGPLFPPQVRAREAPFLPQDAGLPGPIYISDEGGFTPETQRK